MNRRHALRLIAGTSTVAALPLRPAWALDDPRPEPTLAVLLGEWRGSLTYRDDAKPDSMVTLPTRLFVSAVAPDEIALHFVYDDGPGKTVYGYERMRFEFASDTLLWISGAVEKRALVGRIVQTSGDATQTRYVVETTKDGALTRYTLDFAAGALTMQKDGIDSGGRATLRNRYAFTR